MGTFDTELNDAPTRSRSEYRLTRANAIPDLGLQISQPAARARLVEMLDDNIATMEFDAAEVLTSPTIAVSSDEIREARARWDAAPPADPEFGELPGIEVLLVG